MIEASHLLFLCLISTCFHFLPLSLSLLSPHTTTSQPILRSCVWWVNWPKHASSWKVSFVQVSILTTRVVGSVRPEQSSHHLCAITEQWRIKYFSPHLYFQKAAQIAHFVSYCKCGFHFRKLGSFFKKFFWRVVQVWFSDLTSALIELQTGISSRPQNWCSISLCT